MRNDGRFRNVALGADMSGRSWQGEGGGDGRRPGGRRYAPGEDVGAVETESSTSTNIY